MKEKITSSSKLMKERRLTKSSTLSLKKQCKLGRKLERKLLLHEKGHVKNPQLTAYSVIKD